MKDYFSAINYIQKIRENELNDILKQHNTLNIHSHNLTRGSDGNDINPKNHIWHCNAAMRFILSKFEASDLKVVLVLRKICNEKHPVIDACYIEPKLYRKLLAPIGTPEYHAKNIIVC